VSLIYGEYLANVHFGDIPHTFISHFTLHSAEKIRIEFSANYPPIPIDNFLHSAFHKIPLPDVYINYSNTTKNNILFIDVSASRRKPSSGLTSGAGCQYVKAWLNW